MISGLMFSWPTAPLLPLEDILNVDGCGDVYGRWETIEMMLLE
jgi:hypothetical protein